MSYLTSFAEKTSIKNTSLSESLSLKKGISAPAVPALQRQADEDEMQMKREPVQLIEEDEPLQGKFAAVQLAGEEEEPMQGKFVAQLEGEEDELQMKKEPAQLVGEEEEPVQGKFNPALRKNAEAKTFQFKETAVQRQEEGKSSNNTGMPSHLKSGVENLSGFSMDDVKVHYNSDKPKQLQAHAYAQGTDIHIAPGQEKHLPHEAWHVAQQKQGRVQATTQMKTGTPVNDDKGLENEADVMGAQAATQGKLTNVSAVSQFKKDYNHTGFSGLTQRKVIQKEEDNFRAQIPSSIGMISNATVALNSVNRAGLATESDTVGTATSIGGLGGVLTGLAGSTTTSKKSPVQFNKYNQLVDPDEEATAEGPSVIERAKAIAAKIAEATDKEAFLAIINGKLDGSGLEISEEGGLIIDGTYGISSNGASYTTGSGKEVGLSAEGISLTGTSGSLKIGKAGVEAEFEDMGASLSGEGASFKFAGQNISINFKDKAAQYKFEESFSIPEGGAEAEWASVGLSFPVLPGLNVAGSIGVGGGADLDLEGTVNVKKEGSPISKYIGELNSVANASASLFANARLGAEAGVLMVATVGGGFSAKLSASSKASLKVDVKDIVKQADRWTSGGIKLNFKMDPTDIEGAVSLYVEAKLFGGLFSKGKEILLASKKLASFKGYEFAKEIGVGGTSNIDAEALRKQMLKGDTLTPNDEVNAMTISLVQQLFALKVLKNYQAASDKVQNKRDKIRTSKSKKPQRLRGFERDQHRERSWLEENMKNDNEIKNLATKKRTGGGDGGGSYRQISDAPLIYDQITKELGGSVTKLIKELEAAFGLTGKQLVAKFTPDNAEKIVKVLQQIGAVDFTVKEK